MSSRLPNYVSAINILKFYLLLERSKRPVAVSYLVDYLSVSEITLNRYVKAINEFMGNTEGGRLIKYKIENGEKYLYLNGFCIG